MNKRIFLIASMHIVVLLLHFPINAICFDDKITHPEITGRAVRITNIDGYLKDYLGFEDGINAVIPPNPENSIIHLLEAGSTDEDTPNCRAANHFHNPLLPWGESMLTDDTSYISTKFINPFCTATGWFSMNRRSSITWATGYLSPALGETVRSRRGA